MSGYEFIADGRSMLGCIDQAVLLGLDILSKFWIILQVDALFYDTLGPAQLVQALAVKHRMVQNVLVGTFFVCNAHHEEEHSKYLVDEHMRFVFLRQLPVVSLPGGTLFILLRLSFLSYLTKLD